MASPRSSYANIVRAGCFLLVLGSRYRAWIADRRLCLPAAKFGTARFGELRSRAVGCVVFRGRPMHRDLGYGDLV